MSSKVPLECPRRRGFADKRIIQNIGNRIPSTWILVQTSFQKTLKLCCAFVGAAALFQGWWRVIKDKRKDLCIPC